LESPLSSLQSPLSLMNNETLFTNLSKPSPQSLWQLRDELLCDGVPVDSSLIMILGHAFDFLNELEARLTAQGYTELASMLDMGALGMVALQNLVDGGAGTDEFLQRFLLGALSEGLMIAASRQYIRGARAEVHALFQNHAWILHEAFWQLSVTQRPELDGNGRSATLATLFDPIWDNQTEPMAKAALLGRLYQILLLVHLSDSTSQ
jgi:hypothetical protein